jgi:hypothetical protein
MALSGTLQDFGIADILQLIGHQTKTGRLTLKSGADEVEVFFVEGNVVFASDKTRNSRSFLGSLLLQGELLTALQLEEALATQKRTLKRLGDILVAMGAVSQAQVGQMMRLQTTETLYKLFSWKTGSYEFSQEDVDPTRGAFDPVRAESILLEGFRRMDEWPALKKKLPWSDATFEVVRELDVTAAPAAADDFEDDEGPTERHKLVYGLAAQGRDVQGVVNASRAGEFEARKAIQALVEWGYLKIVPPPSGAAALGEGLKSSGQKLARSGVFVRLAVAVACFGGTLVAARILAPELSAVRAESPAGGGAAARLLARDQLVRLESALELYRAEHGEYPARLDQLVEGQLVIGQDLRYPYREAYYYRRTPQGFVLLPPLD